MMVALIIFLVSCDCKCTVWFFFMTPWVGLRYVIVVIPGHIHLLSQIHAYFDSYCLHALMIGHTLSMTKSG